MTEKPSSKTTMMFTSNSTLNVSVIIVGQVKTRGNTMYKGIARFRHGVPSQICRFWISVASLAGAAPTGVIVSTRTNCSSIDVILDAASSTVISPVKGALSEQFVRLKRPRTENFGIVARDVFLTFSKDSGLITKSTGELASFAV